jgi:hypothetical protein
MLIHPCICNNHSASLNNSLISASSQTNRWIFQLGTGKPRRYHRAGEERWYCHIGDVGFFYRPVWLFLDHFYPDLAPIYRNNKSYVLFISCFFQSWALYKSPQGLKTTLSTPFFMGFLNAFFSPSYWLYLRELALAARVAGAGESFGDGTNLI